MSQIVLIVIINQFENIYSDFITEFKLKDHNNSPATSDLLSFQ